MRVWQRVGSLAKGPTLSSLLGMVKLKGVPDWEVNVISIVAGREGMRSQAIP